MLRNTISLQKSTLQAMTLLTLLFPRTGFAIDDPKSYNLELRSSFRYDAGTGNVASTPTDEGTEINEVRTAIDLGVGFLLGDTMEPIFEVGYSALDRKVATFVEKETTLSYGVGALFNMPMASDRKFKKKDSEEKADERGDFVRANWIPYLGFLLAQDTEKASRGTDGQFEVTDGDLVTKLVVGIRWMIYPHIALNFSTRASYQNSSSNAKSALEEGGAITKLEIEARLLELSLFL